MQLKFVLLCLTALTAAWAEEAVEKQGEEETVLLEDPCHELECPMGTECVLQGSKALCQCADKCAAESVQVCSTQNVTFSSLCELERQRCLCRGHLPGCQDPNYADNVLDYYEECTELRDCSSEEKEQFPDRTRAWFFNVMEELSKEKQLRGTYEEWAKQALQSEKHWVLPAVWKFCDLDKSPGDNHVTHEELHEFIAQLKRHEPCLVGFLDTCDSDNDGNITFKEWGVCLGMSDDETESFSNHCQQMRGESESL